MSTTDKKSFWKFMFGTYQRSVVLTAIGVCVALGNVYSFNIVDMSSQPKPPVWQTGAAGLAFSAFILPFFFMSMSRLLSLMSPWKAIHLLTAGMLAPAIMQRMSFVSITDPFALLGGCIVLILLALPITTWIIGKRKKPVL